MTETTDIGWAILELMGHRKLAGFITDDQGLVRIDVYTDEALLEDIDRAHFTPIATQWYGRAAIYCITATTVANCVGLSKSHQPAPIGRWELPAPERNEDEPEDAELAPDYEY
jgi:hypothetical protein